MTFRKYLSSAAWNFVFTIAISEFIIVPAMGRTETLEELFLFSFGYLSLFSLVNILFLLLIKRLFHWCQKINDKVLILIYSALFSPGYVYWYFSYAFIKEPEINIWLLTLLIVILPPAIIGLSLYILSRNKKEESHH